MYKFELSQKDESRWQSTDSSKAYRNTSAFKWSLLDYLLQFGSLFVNWCCGVELWCYLCLCEFLFLHLFSDRAAVSSRIKSINKTVYILVCYNSACIRMWLVWQFTCKRSKPLHI